MVYKQSNDTAIQIEFFDIELSILAWGLDNAMIEYYNDKMLEKAIIQIRR